MDCIPIPIICFQCGTYGYLHILKQPQSWTPFRDQNPCHCKVVGPTFGFVITVGMAVRNMPIHNVCTDHWIQTDRVLAREPAVLLLRNGCREKVSSRPGHLTTANYVGCRRFRLTLAMRSRMPFRYDYDQHACRLVEMVNWIVNIHNEFNGCKGLFCDLNNAFFSGG